jgi:hypothetical protein
MAAAVSNRRDWQHGFNTSMTIMKDFVRGNTDVRPTADTPVLTSATYDAETAPFLVSAYDDLYTAPGVVAGKFRYQVDDPAMLPERQSVCLHSFVPAVGAVPDELGMYGVLKCRGLFQSVAAADASADALLIKDAYHGITTGAVGHTLPVTEGDAFTETTVRMDVRSRITTKDEAAVPPTAPVVAADAADATQPFLDLAKPAASNKSDIVNTLLERDQTMKGVVSDDAAVEAAFGVEHDAELLTDEQVDAKYTDINTRRMHLAQAVMDSSKRLWDMSFAVTKTAAALVDGLTHFGDDAARTAAVAESTRRYVTSMQSIGLDTPDHFEELGIPATMPAPQTIRDSLDWMVKLGVVQAGEPTSTHNSGLAPTIQELTRTDAPADQVVDAPVV